MTFHNEDPQECSRPVVVSSLSFGTVTASTITNMNTEAMDHLYET